MEASAGYHTFLAKMAKRVIANIDKTCEVTCK